MTVPVSRATFKEWCLRKIGKPLNEINIDDDQLDDRVDEAIQYYYDYHFDGTERVYYKYPVTAQDITNQYIVLPDNIIGAVDLFPIGDALNVNNLFNIRYQIALNDLYTLTSVSMVPYVMAMTHIQWLEQILVGKQPLRYNRNVNILNIDMDWSIVNAGDFLIVYAYQTVSPDVYVKAWRDPLLQRLATAMIKEQYGENLSKFQDMPLPGGMKFNGQRLKEEAREERLKAEEDIRNSSLPVSDWIG